MLSLLSMVLSVAATPFLPVAGASTLRGDEPPVRLWMNGDRRFEPGDRARIQVEARDDGFLLVLNYDTDGRVRVLYPLDPRDDGFVRGGRRYEVRDERARESFVVGGRGAGFVYVALSPDPWRLRDWSRGGNWDYNQVRIDYASNDPERDLTDLLEEIAGPRGFDYDLLEYFVHDVEIVRYEYRAPRYYAPGVWAGDPWCDPYWSTGWFCSARPGVVISYGRYYGGGWWSAGYGPSWYWPYESWYDYRPYSYGRGYYYTHHRPWVWTSPTHRPLNGRPVIVGRSRDYTTGRLSPWTFASGGDTRVPSARGGADLPDDYRPREGGNVRSRPVTGGGTLPTPDIGRGRPASDRGAVAPSTGRARGGGDRQDDGNAPDARPVGRRGGNDAVPPPAARPAPERASPPPAPPRARSRGNDPAEARDVAPSREVAPERAAGRPADNSRSRSARPAAVRMSEPPQARRVADRAPARPTPAAERPSARQAPASTRRVQPRQAPPSRAAAPKAASARRDPPARSRGGNGNSRPRGKN